MSASIRPSERLVLGDVEDFVEACAQQAWFLDIAIIDLQTAVDNLQRLAELWGLIGEVGQDRVQAIMAAAFASACVRAEAA